VLQVLVEAAELPSQEIIESELPLDGLHRRRAMTLRWSAPGDDWLVLCDQDHAAKGGSFPFHLLTSGSDGTIQVTQFRSGPISRHVASFSGRYRSAPAASFQLPSIHFGLGESLNSETRTGAIPQAN
jgi:hypothetical protein